MNEPLKIIDYPDKKYITIEGINYAYELFIDLAFAPVGTKLEIIERSNGTVALRRLKEAGVEVEDDRG